MRDELRTILEGVRTGRLDVDAALQQLAPIATPTQPVAGDPTAPLGFANVDLAREERCGFPEVVFCQGKTPAQTTAIATEILHRSPRVLLTRATAADATAVRERWPAAIFDADAAMIVIDETPLPRTGHVAIVAAGTSDRGVLRAAELTANAMGAQTSTHLDVGVAGLHRLLAEMPRIRSARVIVAIAGMEGALASVVGGLVNRPVIAVPTSVGYGLHLGGLTALLAMLNSCAAGVGVVNVDNGFGGGYLAALINRVAGAVPNPPSHQGPST